MDILQCRSFYNAYLASETSKLNTRLKKNKQELPFPEMAEERDEMFIKYPGMLSLKKELPKVFHKDIFCYNELGFKFAELLYRNEQNQRFRLWFDITKENNRVALCLEFKYTAVYGETMFCAYPRGKQVNIPACLQNLFYCFNRMQEEVIPEFNITIGLDHP